MVDVWAFTVLSFHFSVCSLRQNTIKKLDSEQTHSQRATKAVEKQESEQAFPTGSQKDLKATYHPFPPTRATAQAAWQPASPGAAGLPHLGLGCLLARSQSVLKTHSITWFPELRLRSGHVIIDQGSVMAAEASLILPISSLT